MRVAVVQLNSNDDIARNVRAAGEQVAAAAAAGATFVALPEKWSLLSDGPTTLRLAEPLDGTAVSAAREWARSHRIHLLAGSVAELVPGEEKLANTSLLIDPDGEIVARYRKIHMFDVNVGEVSYRESAHERAGSETVVTKLDGIGVGMTVCYDLRFPELFRILAIGGARLITVPSAFTAVTGRDHWEILLRARAIENQAFVVAPNQVGPAPPEYESWGHSLIADPWGVVLAEVVEGVGYALGDLDFAEQERIRRDLPSLANRRPDAYEWPTAAQPLGTVG